MDMICRIADRCPVGDLFFRINDLVCSVAKQELCLYIPLCTRYDHFSAKFFQKRSCLQGILEIASDCHKTNIIIFDSKRLQKILIGTVTDLCVCNIRKNFIDKIFILIHSHYFMSKLIQLVCNMLSKSSESDKQNIFHYPKTATVERDGKELQVPVEEVQLGETLIVKAGESVPVDGIVIEGFSSVDESALTGESIPVEKHIGDKVIGATTSKSGYFKMQATKVGDDTTLAQIVRLVDEATSSKAPIAKLADKVSGVFVPVVISIALIAVIVWLLLGYVFRARI